MTLESKLEPHLCESLIAFSKEINYLRFNDWCNKFFGSLDNALSMKKCEFEVPTKRETTTTDTIFLRQVSPFWKSSFLLGNPIDKELGLPKQQFYIAVKGLSKELHILGDDVYHFSTDVEFCPCNRCVRQNTALSMDFYSWLGQYL